MKPYLKSFALVSVLVMGTAFAAADTLTFVSYGSTGSVPVGANNSALALGPTFNLSTGGLWTAPLNNYGVQSNWVSFNPNDCPGCSGPFDPLGTYTFTTALNDIAGETYSGTLNVMADDTVDVFIDGVKIISDSVGSPNDNKCESNVPNCTTPESVGFSYTATGSDTLTFQVIETRFGTPTGVDFDAQVTSVPEPGSLMLLGTGLLGSAGMLLRRRRA